MTAPADDTLVGENTFTSDKTNEIMISWIVGIAGALSVILFNTLPAFLGALAQFYGFSNAQLGTLASAYFLGHTLMTIVAGLFLKRLNLRWAALCSALVTAACFLLMMGVSDYQALLGLLSVTGLGGGTLFVLAIAVLSSGERATRNIGLCFMLQMIFAAVSVYLFPTVIIPQWGVNGVLTLFSTMFLVIAGLSAVYGRADVVAAVIAYEEAHEHKGGWSFEARPLLALFAMFVYFVGMAAMWAFVERIGSSAGFDPVFVGTVLTGSLIGGALASLLTVVLENRLGLRLPILASCILGLVGMVLLVNGGEKNGTLFAVGVICIQFGWVSGVNYISGGIAVLDRTGDHAPLNPAAMGLGVILGPAIGGVLSEQSFTPLIIMAAGAALFVAVVMGLSPLLQGIRQSVQHQ